MGADLIGYIIFAPILAPKDGSRIRAAAQAKKVLDLIEPLKECSDGPDELLDKIDVLDDDAIEKHNAWTEALKEELGGEVQEFDMLAPACNFLFKRSAGEWVDAAYDALWGSGYRDQQTRHMPGSKRQVVFAGEMSWGDEPEGGAYEVIKAMFYLGFANILKVE